MHTYTVVVYAEEGISVEAVLAAIKRTGFVPDSARMLAMLEAMAGTFYMTILIARLVAVYSFRIPSDRRKNNSDPDPA